MSQQVHNSPLMFLRQILSIQMKEQEKSFQKKIFFFWFTLDNVVLSK